MDPKFEDRYEVRIRWSEEDSTFVADFPGLPSSGSGLLFPGVRGDTRREALTNAEALLRELAEAGQAGREGPVAGPQHEPLPEAAPAEPNAQEAPRSAVTDPSTIETDKKDAREVGIDLDRLGDL